MQVAIIGAGITGLTLAKILSDRGIKTVLIERENAVGGLARSFTYSNDATFDVGPHRFHTENSEVNRFILDTLKENYDLIDRNSQLFLSDRYLPWPLTLKSVLSLPPQLLFRSGIDLFMRKKAETNSFEDYIIEKYGKNLYEVFFKPYTERFLDYTCPNLHRDWASTGINRATIDKKIDTGSLISLLKSVLFSGKVETKFIYPRSGGIGIFSDILAEKIKDRGGRILLSTQITKFVEGNKRINLIVTDKGEEIPVEHVFWSGSLTSLRSLGNATESVPMLHYMSTVIFNYLTTSRIEQNFQWCYFGGKGLKIDRVSVPRNFNHRLVAQGKEGLCVEVSCNEESITWKDPARLDCVVETFLLRAKLLRSLDQVENYHIERIHETYPLYVLNYPRKLKANFDWVNTKWQNMTLCGRTGRFWYNNMDNSIDAALKTAGLFVDDYQRGSLRHGDSYSVEDRYLKDS